MTFVVDGTNGLTFNDATTQASTATNASNISSGTLAKARLPTGSVLQVVFGSTGTQFTTTSGTRVNIGLSATITPTFTSSKILVLVDINGVFVNAVNNAFAYSLLERNGVFLGQFGYIIGFADTTSFSRSGVSSFSFLDAPSTTSALTYQVQGAVANGGTVNYQRDNQAISTILLMEISA